MTTITGGPRDERLAAQKKEPKKEPKPKVEHVEPIICRCDCDDCDGTKDCDCEDCCDDCACED